MKEHNPLKKYKLSLVVFKKEEIWISGAEIKQKVKEFKKKYEGKPGYDLHWYAEEIKE